MASAKRPSVSSSGGGSGGGGNSLIPEEDAMAARSGLTGSMWNFTTNLAARIGEVSGWASGQEDDGASSEEDDDPEMAMKKSLLKKDKEIEGMKRELRELSHDFLSIVLSTKPAVDNPNGTQGEVEAGLVTNDLTKVDEPPEQDLSLRDENTPDPEKVIIACENFWIENQMLSVDDFEKQKPFGIVAYHQWYREYFFNNDHTNFFGLDTFIGPVIVSAVKERWDDGKEYYRCLMRTRDGVDQTVVLPIERLSSNFNSVSSYKLLRCLNPFLTKAKFKVQANENFPGAYMKMQENEMTTQYKIGILYAADGQTDEEQMFGNANGSDNFNEFLDCIGEKVELLGFKGFAGGLDTKRNTTGTHSYYARWRDKYELMFHVSTLLPFNPVDPQQLERKRHLGNDVALVVFVDGDTPFHPETIKTHFIHVIIVVQIDHRDEETGRPVYRLTVSSRKGVPLYEPLLTPNRTFAYGDEFRDLLFAKLINGEVSAYKAPRFAARLRYTRAILFDDLVKRFACLSEQPEGDHASLATALH